MSLIRTHRKTANSIYPYISVYYNTLQDATRHCKLVVIYVTLFAFLARPFGFCLPGYSMSAWYCAAVCRSVTVNLKFRLLLQTCIAQSCNDSPTKLRTMTFCNTCTTLLICRWCDYSTPSVHLCWCTAVMAGIALHNYVRQRSCF